MADIITRAYGDHENALAVVNELKAYRFNDAEITAVSYLGGQRAGSNVTETEFNKIVDSITAGFVLKSDAVIYAKSVCQGATLITVRAPFGTGGRATTIMDSFEPIETGVRAPESSRPKPWDDATPASSFLHLRVLLDDSATFSGFWNLPVLLKQGRTVFSRLGIPEVLSARASSATLLGIPAVLKRSPAISALLGLPLATRANATLSSVLHIRLLLSDKASFSGFFDMPWLRAKATPLSSALHIPTLMKSTSISGLAGVPTLSGNTPVSSVLGIPTLIKSKFPRS